MKISIKLLGIAEGRVGSGCRYVLKNTNGTDNISLKSINFGEECNKINSERILNL